MTITTKDTFGNERTYEIIKKIPVGFFVWNIGENMGSDEYIPVCEWKNREEYTIKLETVKALKLDPEEVKIIRQATSWGIGSRADAKRALKSVNKQKRDLAAKSIAIYERITA